MMLCGVCNPERPPVFKKINQIPAGALFIAIEKNPPMVFLSER